jgi:lipoyl-dependent peroxiredoxin
MADLKTPEKIVYAAKVTSTGGRKNGHVVSDDGVLDIRLAPPKEMGGPGDQTNPEQLFAAGYATCFTGALGLVAGKQGIDISAAQVTAEVGIGPEGESYGLTVAITVEVPGVDAAKVQELADAAHAVCPYSKATRGNIPVTVTGA